MASIFSKLFGGGASKEPAKPTREDPVSYEGYSIISAPEKTQEGQWRLSGFIVKEVGGVSMERMLVRVDSFMSREEAVKYTEQKAKQVIDQQGGRLFADGAPTGRA